MTTATYRDLRVADIDRNPGQPRKLFDETALDELAASLRASGLLQPIVVRHHPKEPGRWLIIAGERRWRAAQRAGLDVVPCRILTDLDEEEAYVLSVAENVARKDMTIIEEAESFQTLVGFGKTTAEIAGMFGKSRTHVEWRLGLLDLSQDLRLLVVNGSIKPNLAWHIARCSESNQMLVANRVMRGDFKSEFEAANFAQALAAAEKQSSMFELEEETPELREKRQARKRAALSTLDRIDRLAELLAELAGGDPEDLADALGAQVASTLERVERVAGLATRARSQMRKAKGVVEAREIVLNPEAVA